MSAADDRTMDWLVLGLALLCAVLAVGLLIRRDPVPVPEPAVTDVIDE